MEAFEIYTLGSGFYLEKVFNALRLIFASGFNDILKTAAITSILILALRASITNDFKETVKWILGVVILTSLFLTTKAKVVIIEQLPNNSGMIPAARMVEDVPWGLAMIGSTTSIVGKTLMEKFDISFAGATNNEGYQKTGIMFGSKIVEDASRIKISSPSLRNVMVKFYRQCMIPDLKMGHNRANGYSFDELSESDDITAFLKNHASKARNIYIDAKVTKRVRKDGAFGRLLGSYTDKQSTEKGYYSCNQAAHMIGDMIEFEVESNMSQLSSSFISQFTGKNGQKNNVVEKNAFYKSILQNNYSKFLETSKDASSILMQNVMINSIRDSASSVANTYGQFSTEEMSKSSFYSVSQVFQRFIPIIRAVFECLFYGVSPIVLILMVTPIGLDVLKNYAFSFVYLQMWPPMYSILYSITEAWGSMSASGLKLNMRFLPQIESINADISMVSGYMLALIPVLSMFVTKGLVASIGNMATSMMYIPQTSAVQSAEQAVRGNYSFGNTSIDTHSYNNLSANKHDDNYQWMSGMKSFALPSGASMKSFADGRVGLDASGAMSNLGGQVSIGWNKAIGSSLNESENNAQNEVERHSKDYTESASAGMSKMLGYNSNYSKGTSAYESINQSLTSDQRQSFDHVRGVTDRIAKDNNISSEDALRMSMAIKGGASFGNLFGQKPLGIGLSLEAQGYTASQVRQAWSQTQDAMTDSRFSESLSSVESIGKTKSIQTQDSSNQDVLSSIKSDFNKASNASSSYSSSMDKLHSIQTAKTNYENSSSNFDKQFTNMFIEDYVGRYGVGAFEKLVRENPNNIDPLVNKFISEHGIVQELAIGSQTNTKNYDLVDGDISKMETILNNNDHLLDVASRGFTGNALTKKNDLEVGLVDAESNFELSKNGNVQKIDDGNTIISGELKSRKQETEEELSNTASGKLFKRLIK